MNPHRLIANLKSAIEYAKEIKLCRNDIALAHRTNLFNAVIDNAIEELKELNLSGEINREMLIEEIMNQV